ncbi:hypothetical protein SNE40_018727 [Patella caerulea]|uniref:Hexosyltransferase n=1 Tax=Patella caerulea TaxID=87958 RepID=A0AAN8P8G3_PATCE
MINVRPLFVMRACLKYFKYGTGILIIFICYFLWIQTNSNCFQDKLNSTQLMDDNSTYNLNTPPTKVRVPKLKSINSKKSNPIFNGQYILNNINICNQFVPVDIIVVVHSNPAHFAQRFTIRRTCGMRKLFLPIEVRVIFLLGRVDNKKIHENIINEHSRYGDTIQGDFKDAYHNLTFKAVMGLHWVSHYCSDAKYVIKIDDDVVFNMWRFLKEVYAKHLYSSKAIYGISKFRDLIPRTGKWSVPFNILKGFKYYPYEFCTGFVLIMSADIIPDLYRASFKVPFFWLDDVYVTGMLRTVVGGIAIKQKETHLILSPESDGLKCLKEMLYVCPYLAVGYKSLRTYKEVWKLFKKRNEK